MRKRRGPDEHADEHAHDTEGDLVPEVDLHGLTPAQALRRLARELHAARTQRRAALVVITGRGFGNARQEPVLRTQVEQWLLGPEGRRLGVESYARVHRGGALRVALRT